KTGFCRKNLSIDGSTSISNTVRYGRYARVIPTRPPNLAEITSLTTEPWGVRRFFVRAPDGNVINIAHHRG
ncbi:hypothetical protein U2F26_22575, partial [Micromonospora sp. 4G57]|nr:hypothetical protein [Micromonospora sp. 4G57]MDZ5491587.1 hypothetical protein [Micromonospora sp. 4G53]